MCTDQIIKMVTIIILALIAVGAIWYGGRKKRRDLYTTGFGLLLISVIFFFVYFREYTPIFSAWAAVAVAIAFLQNQKHLAHRGDELALNRLTW